MRKAQEAQGVVSVRRACTHEADASKGRRIVQDRIWHDGEDVRELFRKGANLYLCGAGVVGTGVEGAMAKIRAEARAESIADATEWVKKVKGERFSAGVFV